ncbi:ABC transporter permease [Mobilitalea sibirica]|uniref:ABC transporter permease n=1 Tax=Mobilitalea sibirica TaxID=1462919 RepID=A0A8J7HB53_9FIRM|nr:ABC transporter permease [Mobilitalea sibirica]MBH1939607.1 ABC transporter permease [Mobilitalea sibirica]
MIQKTVINIPIKKAIQNLVVLLFGVLLWAGSIVNQKQIEDYHSGVSVRYVGPQLTEQQIKYILQSMSDRQDANIPEITLWQREENILVSREGMKRSLDVSLVTVAGDMSKVHPGMLVLGGYPSSEDLVGCILDRDTARKLFGSENVVGMKLKLREKEYIIRGIMKKGNRNMIIIRAEENGISDQYSCMELQFSETHNADTLAKEFVSTYGLGEPAAYINGYAYRYLADRVVHIPVWLCVIWIVILMLRKVYRWKASLILSILGYLSIILFSMILFKLTDFRITFPSSLIPNRWSDFDFWVSQWRKMGDMLREREGMLQYYKEIVLRKRFFIVVLGVIPTIIAEVIVIRGMSRE